MTAEQKEYLSGEILRIFREEKRSRLGRRYQMHDRFKNPVIWEDAAVLCGALGATPGEFVRSAFDGCRMKEGPQPTHLKSKKAMNRWWADFSRARPAGGTEANTWITELDESVPGLMDWRLKAATEEALALLRDSKNSYPEWFRVVMRPDDGLIWNEFGWVAVKQLLQKPRLVNELRDKGFNVDQIINHEDIPQPPIWVQQLKDSGIDTESYEY